MYEICESNGNITKYNDIKSVIGFINYYGYRLEPNAIIYGILPTLNSCGVVLLYDKYSESNYSEAKIIFKRNI